MAYNPFNIFRRNQRAIFAVMTVLIMFMFVLSSGMAGKADFFNWFPEWLGSKGRKGEAVCSIDGSRVSTRDVAALRRQRVMASRFMEAAAVEGIGGLRRALREAAAQGSPEFATLYRSVLENPNPDQWLLVLPGLIRSAPNAKPADKEAADILDAMAGAYVSLERARRAGNYFGVPNRTGRDAVEFMLWDKKAQDLGVSYSADEVRALIDQEFRGQFRNDAEIVQALRREMPGFSLEACQDALAAEFRVRTARTALLGPDLGRADRTLASAPLFAPPFEVFEFYRDKTSPTLYEVLAVPAAALAGAVPGQPTEDELRRLFDDRKDAEPDPAKEEPGFREPRKVKVEWVSATGEEPYYQAKARAAVEAAEKYGTSPVIWGLTVPTPGAEWLLTTAAPAALTEPLVQAKYQSEVADRHRSMTRYNWSGIGPVTAMDLLDTSVVQPKTLAAAAGGLGNPLATTGLAYTAAVAAEQRARVRAGLPLVLAGVPGPGLLPQLVGAEAEFRAALPDPLPLAAVKPELLKGLVEAKARELALADLKKLRDEVAKLTDNGKAKDKGPAKAYIAEFVKERGLKAGASADFQSEWTIADDPGLAPLKAVIDKPGLFNPHGSLPVAFGRKFFYTERLAPGGMSLTTAPAAGTYQPELYPEQPGSGLKGDPMFVAWRTEERPARGRSFEEARADVAAAWKRRKARDLAKAEADRVAAAVQALPAGASADVIRQRLRDLQAELQAKAADPKAKDRVKLFQVRDVSPLQVGPDLSMLGQGGPLRRFQLAPTADLLYPTAELEKALLEKRTDPVKTAVVLPDAPKDTYYVAVVADRRERSPEEYRAAMFFPAAAGGGRGGLKEVVTGEFRREAGRKAEESVLGIIKKQYRYEETPEQKKRLDDAEKSGGEV
ncbi:MAG: hypothetical protein K2X87_01530 [Gemmataceae bacterium]|nr:hypothetical protein [Gemmataceae bacterium]